MNEHYQAQYYYYRDKKGRPVITQCVLYEVSSKGKKTPVVVGNAICSPTDNPCKEKGRSEALHRALAFLEDTEKSVSIFQNPKALVAICSVDWARYNRLHYSVFMQAYFVDI